MPPRPGGWGVLLLSYRGQGHLLGYSWPSCCGCTQSQGGGTAILMGSESRDPPLTPLPVATEDRAWSQRILLFVFLIKPGLFLSLKIQWNLLLFQTCLRTKTPFFPVSPIWNGNVYLMAVTPIVFRKQVTSLVSQVHKWKRIFLRMNHSSSLTYT